MSLYNITNQRLTNFIKNNSESGVVIQMKKANEQKDREAFALLLQSIKDAIRIEDEIERDKQRIQSHITSIKDIKREIKIKKNFLKNEKNFHKIKRENG